MIIEKLYHTFIDTEQANINITLNYDGTTTVTNTSTSFDITIRLTDFKGNSVVGESITVQSYSAGGTPGYFINNEESITGTTDAFGEVTFKFTVNSIGNYTFICNDATLNVRVYRDTGWQGVTYASGYANYSSNHPLEYKVRDNLVEIRGMAKNTSAVTPNTTATTIATIPQVFRPESGMQVYRLHYAGYNQNNANQILTEINNTNGIQFQRYGTTSTNTQVPANTCLNINFVYRIHNQSI